MTNKEICSVEIHPLYDETGVVRGTSLYYDLRHVNLGYMARTAYSTS
jgi:hypothetical protein